MDPATGASKGRILIVEDEPDLCRLLAHNLAEAGFETRAVHRGAEALALLETFSADLVVLDLMLPDISGLEVCRRIRRDAPQRAQPTIVMLTARGEEIDRVVGFELGADDYVAKPFSLRELVLRIEARLRSRSGAPASPAPPEAGWVAMGPLEVDTVGQRVFAEGQEVRLTALEMRLLVHFLAAPGHVRTREQLLEAVWGYQASTATRTVDAHVKRLRDKLGAAGRLIQTVHGIGYRLVKPEPAQP